MRSGYRQLVASATPLLTLLMALFLGLSMVAAGTRTEGARRVQLERGVHADDEVSAARVSTPGSRLGVSNQDAPGKPPLRLLGEQAQDSEDDNDDERPELAHVSRSTVQLRLGMLVRVSFVEQRSNAAQRVREGHGARGPPLA